MSMTNSSGNTAPITPNWARLWIICGIPSFGPWAECEAMKTAPINEPRMIAIALQNRFRPMTTGSTPEAMVVMFMLAPNQM
ncbi:hypothetical protein D3C86_1702600 [compost metagenome]